MTPDELLETFPDLYEKPSDEVFKIIEKECTSDFDGILFGYETDPDF